MRPDPELVRAYVVVFGGVALLVLAMYALLWLAIETTGGW